MEPEKVRYVVQKNPSFVPISNAVHTATFYFLKIHFNIIPTSTRVFWEVFPREPCMHLSCRTPATRPAHQILPLWK
jgi:hypothetical protein